jgi:hypothetical protein
MSEGKENFLDRWSRLKEDTAKEEVKPPVEKDAAKKAEPAPVLPPIEQLKPDSDFRPFMDPRVDAATRRAALKKLFADGHFKMLDPFEPYSVDLTGEDPIPEEMLKTLDHARRLLFDEKKEPARELAKEPAKEVAEKPLQEAKDVAGKQDA